MIAGRDTIFALSSGASPAAIAILRVSGDAADAAALALAGAPLPPPRRASLRTLRGPDGEIIDHGLVLRFPARGSVTGEPLVEFHVHGGRAVVARMLTVLGEQPGLRLAQPGEFSRRGLLAGRLSLIEAEALGDLLRAETEVERRAALSAHDGALGEQLERWRVRLIDLSARAEALIDHDDDGEMATIVEPALAHDIRLLMEEVVSVAARPTSDDLRDGVVVALAGPPNGGKSSLLNALVRRDAALVSPLAGTTRDLIEVPMVIGGRRVRLVDTAGLRDGTDMVERMGIDRARQVFETAPLLIWLGEDAPPARHGATLHIHARCDIPDGRETAGRLAVSSVTGQGLDALIGWMISQASSLHGADDGITLNARQSSALASLSKDLADAASQHDILLVAEHLRHARQNLIGLTNPTDFNAVMDRLFADFCLGK